MGWAKFDDKRHLNAKLRRAGLEASALDAYAITYCAASETDGYLEVEIVRVLAGCRHWTRLAAALVDAGRWTRDEESRGWWIHDYLEYNPSKQELEEKRAAVAERQRRSRRNNESGQFGSDRRVSHTNVTRDSRVSNTVPDPTRPDPYLKEVKTSLAEQGECTELENTIETPVAKAGVAPRKTRSKTAAASVETAKPRERNLLFDAMAESCGHVLSQMTPSEAARVGVALSQILPQNPTPEIIWEKATLYKKLNPTWVLSATALVAHWSELQPGMERRTLQSVKQDQLDLVTEEILEEIAIANSRNAAPVTSPSTTTDEQEPSEAPRPNSTSRNDGFSHKTRNRASDRPAEANAPKADGPNNDSGSINTIDHHCGLEAPRSDATLESEGILPSSTNCALERSTAPLTESSHDPASGFTNTGSQVQQWKDVPNDDDYQKWTDCQFWEENNTPGDDYAF